MSGFGGLRRTWTHRRLGLGATTPSAAALAHADALLTVVAARLPRDLALELAPDPVQIALLDYAETIDLTIEPQVGPSDAAYLDLITATMSDIDDEPVRRRHPIRWTVLPALSGAVALVIVLAFTVAGRGGSNPSSVTSATIATTESQTLLRHASMLLSAASAAAPKERSNLISEADVDLRHVSALLPYTSAPSRPALRDTLRALHHRSTTASRATATTTGTPAKHQSTDQQPTRSSTSSSGSAGSTGSTTRGGQPNRPPTGSGSGSTAPRAQHNSPPQPSGSQPPQPNPDGPTGTGSNSYQQPFGGPVGPGPNETDRGGDGQSYGGTGQSGGAAPTGGGRSMATTS